MSEKKPFIIKDFSKGWNTELISDTLPVGASPELENVDISATGSVKKTWGYEELGSDADTGTNQRTVVVPDRSGVEWLIKKNGTKLKIYDPTLEVYNTIYTGLTAIDVPDYQYFDTVVYFCSATDTPYTLDLTKITRLTAPTVLADAVVNVSDTTAFAASGTFYLNNTLVTYTGKSGTTFTGCTGTPAAVTTSLCVSPAVVASGIPKSAISVIYAGRLIVAVGSKLYGSKLTDMTNFTVTGSGTADAFIKTIESKCTSLKVFYDDQSNNRLLAFTKNNKIILLDVDDNATLSSTLVTSSSFKEGVTALNHFSTVVGPNNLYHLDLNNQVRSLGQTYANKGVEKVYSDNMSTQHEALFKTKYNFDDAKALVYGNDWQCICREGNGTVNNRLIIFDFVTAAWRKRTNVNANDIALYSNDVIFADASENKIFKFNRSLMADDDETINFEYHTSDLDVDKLRFERLRRVRISGFISTAAIATIKIYRDFATLQIGEFTIYGDDSDITGTVLGSDVGTYGSTVFGGEMFGGSSGGLDTRFFIADLELDTLPDLENFRLVVENNQSNVYLEITAMKPFIEQKPENYYPSKFIKTGTSGIEADFLATDDGSYIIL